MNPATNEHKDQASKHVDELIFKVKVINGGEIIVPESREAARFFDKHANLIAKRKLRSQRKHLLTQFTQELIEGLPVERKQDNVSGKSYHNGFNAAVRECTQSIKATLTKYTGGK